MTLLDTYRLLLPMLAIAIVLDVGVTIELRTAYYGTME